MGRGRRLLHYSVCGARLLRAVDDGRRFLLPGADAGHAVPLRASSSTGEGGVVPELGKEEEGRSKLSLEGANWLRLLAGSEGAAGEVREVGRR